MIKRIKTEREAISTQVKGWQSVQRFFPDHEQLSEYTRNMRRERNAKAQAIMDLNPETCTVEEMRAAFRLPEYEPLICDECDKPAKCVLVIDDGDENESELCRNCVAEMLDMFPKEEEK